MSYLGSKAASGACQAIIAQMPPHDTYIELFMGTGAVINRKPPAAKDIGVEIDRITLSETTIRSSVEVVCVDVFEFLDSFDFAGSGRVHIYADPPYLLSTRTSEKRYRYDFTDHDHDRLLHRLKRLCCSVAISGYPSCVYDRSLQGWRSIEFQVMTRGGPRTEKLWMNYGPGAVQWCDYAGQNYTERQRIKRKAARWAKNYSSMPPGERCAVLAAMLDLGNV